MNISNSTNSTKGPSFNYYFPGEKEILRLALQIEWQLNTYVFPVIFGVASLWNILIIFYFVKINLRNLRKMSSYHFLIINLAVADLCVTLGVSILYPFNVKPLWELGTFGCVFLRHFLSTVCPMISCWLLVLISFARFRSIVYPLRARINKKKYGLACLSVWVIVSLLNLYIFMNREVKVLRSGVFSICLGSGEHAHAMIQYFVTYVLDSFLPFAIMLFLYYQMKKRMNTEENENAFALNEQSRQRNRRALRTIRGLILLFTVTVIPVRICYVLTWVSYFYATNNSLFPFRLTSALVLIFTWLILFVYLMNNALNIFVYAKMIPPFRRFLLTTFTFGMYGKRN